MTVDQRKIWKADSPIIDSGDDPGDASFVGDVAQEQAILNTGENGRLEDWAEADSHIIDLDDPSKENDSFMGTTEDERAIWEAMQNDEEMLNVDEEISDDELASQYGLDAEFQSGVSEDIEEAATVIREDERALMMREAARLEAQLLGLEEELPDDTEDSCENMAKREEEEEAETERLSSFESDVDTPYPCCEGYFLPWDGWMRDVNDQIEILDKRLAEKCEKFDREAFSEQIRKFMLNALRTKVIQENLAASLNQGCLGKSACSFGWIKTFGMSSLMSCV